MACRVEIYISDVVGFIDSGYDQLKIYRSSRKDTDYSEITAAATRPSLNARSQRYLYEDAFGTADSWYKWSFYISGTAAESSLSDPIRGTVSGSYYRGRSYPAEIDMSQSEQDTVFRIRSYTGDKKETNRDYISSSTSYDNVSTDGKTVELDNAKGWPLSICVDGAYYNDITDPVVNGYQFVTFSGTTISTISGSADIWYEHFRFSDREILDFYSVTEAPSFVPSDQITPEMAEVQTAISILEHELRNFMVTSASKIDIFEEIAIDPSAGLKARQDDLDRLRNRLKDIVKATISNNLSLYGVRVD
jgi:hypothetical protein